MSRLVSSALFVALAASMAGSVALLPTSAQAGCGGCGAPLVSPCGSCAAPVVNPCNSCYRPAMVPAQYRTVYDTVVVAPARVVEHRVPARYGVVNETVMVSPPSQAWQSTCACGRESVQAVEIPAQYTTVARTVMVEPPHTVREVVPAQYGTVARTEMVSGPHAVWVPADQY
jgi:hypothetical protein